MISGDVAAPAGEEVSHRALNLSSATRWKVLPVQSTDRAATQSRDVADAHGITGRGGRAGWLTGGGTDGNERLTAITGLVLIVLLAVIGVTIVRIGQLTSVHLFVGLLLIGPVALKMASTGYRFVRYYTGNAIYRGKGPPELILRMVAPVVVICTVVVFVSGVILMFQGRAHRDPMMMIHKVSFIVWVGFFAVHVLGHIPDVVRYIPGLGGVSRARALRELRESIPGMNAPQAQPGRDLPNEIAGRSGRSIALIGALLAGLILALVLLPQFGSWTHHLVGLGEP